MYASTAHRQNPARKLPKSGGRSQGHSQDGISGGIRQGMIMLAISETLPMSQFTALLQNSMDRPVVDQTGLSEKVRLLLR